jgi:hypothetical protein
MLNIAGVNVYLATQPVDMRKGIQGLSLLVSSSFKLNPFSGHVFVFYNKARQKLKLLYYDRNGFALWYKVLEQGRFMIPKLPPEPGGVMCASALPIEPRQLAWLLEGLDIQNLHGHDTLKFELLC